MALQRAASGPAAGGHGVLYVTVDGERSGQRLDNFLVARHRGVPRSLIYRWLRTGAVRVNRRRAAPSQRLQAGDVVRVPPARDLPAAQGRATPSARLARVLEGRILHEDAALLVVDKPAGLASHGGSGIALGLIEALRVLRPDLTGLELVHRLDRETSGCLVLAKRRSALRSLHAALREGRVAKRYVALMCGELSAPVRVDAALQRVERGGERRMAVDPAGQSACTEFFPRERLGAYTLADAWPHTGRTHQLRAHAAHLGLPLAGDEKYGMRAHNAALRERGLRRLFLHAAEIGLPALGEAPARQFRAPLPASLVAVLEALREG